MGTQLTGGVDTHLEVHVAAALDERGGLLGTASFATTPGGYRELVEWFASLGTVVLIGVEGTGSYGAGLTRHLQDLGIAVVEVDRPNRQRRRRQGKSDTHDAISAARAALRVMHSAHPRLVMATSKRSGCCDWLAATPNETEPER
jgi:transposase